MRRVVVTGLGIVSSIGMGRDEVTASLRTARSGVVAAPDHIQHGFRSQVWAPPSLGATAEDWAPLVDRRAARFLANGTAWGHIAFEEALRDSGMTPEEIRDDRIGLIVGEGGPSTQVILQAAQTTIEKGAPKRIGPFAVPKAMASGPSAVLATWFQMRGINYSISSACATSAHCIGAAAEQIQWGKQDVVFAGGVEDIDWSMSNMFDAMGAMSSDFNATPSVASRAYDVARDGFVIAGGAGIVVLEEYDRAVARGARIYAEVVGYGMSGDAYHLAAPAEDGGGAFRAMRMALKRAGLDASDIDYLNAHGTSTPLGDEIELGAVKRLFGAATANLSVSSTKSSVGHLLGAAGAVEAIYSIKAVQDQIVPPTLNLDNPSDSCAGIDLVPHKAKERKVKAALSNSFGFGGTNASLIFKAYA